LEHQLLLKEVCIGRRSQELPSWSGVVLTPLSRAVPSLRRTAHIKSDAGKCPHLPPYADVRAVVPGDFLTRNEEPYPDWVNHYTMIGRCQGTKKTGTPCDCKFMMQNAYLPLTRFRLVNGEIFKFNSWTNPATCRSRGDVVRFAREQTQVDAHRIDVSYKGWLECGWHKFWFDVHHIGAHLGGQHHASQDQLDLCESWLRAEAKNFNIKMKNFQNAGLLVEGGPGDGGAVVRDKFLRAKHILGIKKTLNREAHQWIYNLRTSILAKRLYCIQWGPRLGTRPGPLTQLTSILQPN
jgi:hypothetical protein